jgi:NADH dehydrogenase (ubiquinone) flavoprotein 2
MPALFRVQKQNNNFLTLSAMNKVAKILEMTPMEVYEVDSFYTMFNRTKVGEYHFQV